MKNLLKFSCLFGLVVMLMISCSKENIQQETAEEVATSNNRGPGMDIDPEPFGPDLVITTQITSDLPIVSPSACGGGPNSSGPQPTCGQQYNLDVIVTNAGNAPVTNDYWLRIGKSTGIAFTYDVQSPTSFLAPGASHTFNIGPAPFGGCSGNWSRQAIIGFADVFNDVEETNESNNRSRPYMYCGD